MKSFRGARGVSRRGLLRNAAVIGTVAATAPWVARRPLASSGEINVLMWNDYLPSDWIAAFQSETGIKVNHTAVGSNEDMLAKMKASKGRGFDLVSPTNMRAPQWGELGLLQAFETGRIANLDKVNPAMLRIGTDDWNFGNAGSHWLPHVWGTEAISWRTDLWQPADGTPSYKDVWDLANRGKTMGRPHSMMQGAGLYLEQSGALPMGAMRAAYTDEATMRATWDKVAAFCISRKEAVKVFWTDADAQRNGLLNQGVALGQTLDGPPLAIKSAGDPVSYQAPKEGALAWVDGLSLSAAADNIEQAYAFVDFCYRPELAGKAIAAHGHNSAVLGADSYAGAIYARNFSEAYRGDALANLWPWPTEPQWYANLRAEYRDKFLQA